MADVHSPAVRSYNMSRIRGKNTKPELIVRKFLHANGFRYRLHDKRLPGKPDIVLPKHKTVILVHGCFWHGHHECKYFTIPQTRRRWWHEKITRNKLNDIKHKRALKRNHWKVIEVWTCTLKKNPEGALNNILNKINK